MKYDEAYCSLLEDKLTIYEVRDLNFDETDEFDSDDSMFFVLMMNAVMSLVKNLNWQS